MHETAADLHRLGFIDQRKMRKYEVLCLDPIPEYDSEKIRSLRDRYQLSQTVLASILNTSPSAVREHCPAYPGDLDSGGRRQRGRGAGRGADS